MTQDSGRVRRALKGDESLRATRAIALDDIHIRKSGSGRDVVAYATVWNTPAEIVDSEGHYREQNAPDSMSRSIAERAGHIYSVYNHGRTLHGESSAMDSVPIGKPVEIRADAKGLLTVTRYNKTPRADEVLEAIRSGSLRGMSYTGVFLQSSPPLAQYSRYGPDAEGNLTLVTRQEIALIEYGPTPIPAYSDAEIVGVRNRQLAEAAQRLTTDDVPHLAANPPEREVIEIPTVQNVADDGPSAEAAADATPEPAATDDAPPEEPQRTAEPPEASADAASGSHERASVDNSEWNGSAALSACDTGADFASICAGRKSGPADERQSWALPHHKSPGSPPNAAAVRNALARLSQTQGLTNREAARRHLEAHLASIQAASNTSSSGRNPAPGNARTEPHAHSAATHIRKDTSVENDRQTMTVEERVARQSEIRSRLNEIDTEYSGAELTEEARAEWNGLQQELVVNERAIADANQRAEYLRYINDVNPGATERIDNSLAGLGYQQPAPFPSRMGASGPAFNATRDNIFDLASIRNRARSIDEVPQLYRDYAMRAVEQARFPSAGGYRGAPTKEDAQTRVATLLDTIDDDRGSLARRILVTGSPVYDRAFGKVLARQTMNGLTAEESRALQLGTDSTGGAAVPYQLDPTVILASNGVVNPLRAISRVETITGKEWDGVTSEGVTVTRGTESAEVGTGDPAFEQPTVKTSRVMGWIPFSIELDVSWNALRAQLTAILQDAKDVEEATAFATGNGTAPNPSGVISTLSTASYVQTAGSGALAAGDIYLLENAMAPRFISNSRILGSKTIFNKLRVTFQANASSAGDPFARPSGAMGNTFNGYPMHELSTMSTTAGTGDLVLLQGAFNQFLIVDRVGMGIELVPHLLGSNRRPVGERGVFALWFNNSKILVDNAFRLLRIKSTSSTCPARCCAAC